MAFVSSSTCLAMWLYMRCLMGRYVEIVVFTIHMSHKLSCFNEIGDGLRTEWKINVNEYTTSSIPAGMLIRPTSTLTVQSTSWWRLTFTTGCTVSQEHLNYVLNTIICKMTPRSRWTCSFKQTNKPSLYQMALLLPLTKEEVNASTRICLSVSKITQKCMHGFGWYVACRQMSGHGQTG